MPGISALSALDEAGRREYWAALALRCTRELNSLEAAKLLRHFGSAYEALQDVRLWPEAGVPLKRPNTSSTTAGVPKRAPNGRPPRRWTAA